MDVDDGEVEGTSRSASVEGKPCFSSAMAGDACGNQCAEDTINNVSWRHSSRV